MGKGTIIGLIVGFGEYRPVALSNSEGSKQLNRRIDIVFLKTDLNVYEPESADESN